MPHILFKKFILFLILLTLSGDGKDSDLFTKTGYEIFIQSVENNLTEIQLQKLVVNKNKNAIKKTESVYDSKFHSSIYGYGLKNYDDFSNNKVYTVGAKTSLGIEKKLKSGTEISTDIFLNYHQNRGNIESWQFDENTFEVLQQKQKYRNNMLIPELKFSISQPLLMNRGGLIEKFLLKSAILQSEMEKLNSNLGIEKILESYRKEYIIWLRLNRDLIFMNEIYKKICSQKLRAERMLQEGLLEKDEYAQFKIFCLEQRERIAHVNNEISVKIVKLSPYLSSKTFNEDEFESLFSKNAETKLQLPSFDSTQQGSLFHLMVKEVKEHIQLQKNLLLPELNLFGESTLKHHTNKRIKPTKNKQKSFGVDFSVGAQFTMPIGNKKAKSELYEAKNSQQIIAKEKEIAIRNFSQNFSLIEKYYSLYLDLISQKSELIITLQKKSEIELNKFNQGRIDLYELLDTQAKIIEEQITLNNYKENIINIIFDYLSLIK